MASESVFCGGCRTWFSQDEADNSPHNCQRQSGNSRPRWAVMAEDERIPKTIQVNGLTYFLGPKGRELSGGHFACSVVPVLPEVNYWNPADGPTTVMVQTEYAKAHDALVLAAKNLHDAIGNTTPIASDLNPKVYEAILNLRRELMK